MVILVFNLNLLFSLLIANLIIFRENDTKYCETIGLENVSLKINRKFYWITTLILLFNHSLPMLTVHTVANVYTLSREQTRKS